MPDKNFSYKDALPSVIAGLFFIFQIIYGFFYAENLVNQIISYVGVGVFILSGVFGMAPVIVFPRKGGVRSGKSFVHTTKLVDTGIYSIIRHPQYSSFYLWAIAAMLLFQNIYVILLGIPVIILTYFDMMRADLKNIKKFGDSYKTYMKKVPRANFLLGLIRALKN